MLSKKISYPATAIIILIAVCIFLYQRGGLPYSDLASKGTGPTVNRAKVTEHPVITSASGQSTLESLSSLKAQLELKEFGQDYAEQLAILAERYAKEAPEEGLVWLSTLESSLENSLAFSVFAAEFAPMDINAFCTYAKAIPQDAFRYQFWIGGLRRISKNDPLNAWRLFESNKSTIYNSARFKEELFHAICTRNPKAAWEINKSDPKGLLTDRNAIGSFFRSPALADITEAVNYAKQVDSPELRDEAMRLYIQGIAESQIKNASMSILKLENSDLKDNAISGLISRIYKTSVLDAAEWAVSMSNPALRDIEFARIQSYADSVDSALAQSVKDVRSRIKKTTGDEP